MKTTKIIKMDIKKNTSFRSKAVDQIKEAVDQIKKGVFLF